MPQSKQAFNMQFCKFNFSYCNYLSVLVCEIMEIFSPLNIFPSLVRNDKGDTYLHLSLQLQRAKHLIVAMNTFIVYTAGGGGGGRII